MKALRASFPWALVLAAAVLIPAGCGRPAEEARIKELLKKSVVLAENREIAALMEQFSPEYSDFEGRDKASTERLIADYMGEYRGIVIHLLSSRMDVSGQDGRAAAECEMAFSHGAAEVLRKLFSATSEFYRFRFNLEKNGKGEWRFVHAEWRSISLADLLPESLRILKELFPEL